MRNQRCRSSSCHQRNHVTNVRNNHAALLLSQKPSTATFAQFPAETAASARVMIQLTDSHCDETHTCKRTHIPSSSSSVSKKGKYFLNMWLLASVDDDDGEIFVIPGRYHGLCVRVSSVQPLASWVVLCHTNLYLTSFHDYVFSYTYNLTVFSVLSKVRWH